MNTPDKARKLSKSIKRRALGGFVVGFALACTAASAQESYPARPIRMMVSFAAGGPTDIVARVMSAKMSDLLGQQFVVENRTGAGGNTGAADIAKAPADGYHLLMATVSTHAINPHYYKKIPYDAAKDFAPIGQVGVTPILLVTHPSIPVKDAKGLVDLVKANPGKYTYGSSGVGSILHLCGEQFKTMAGGIDITHIPYRGSSALMKDLIGGQISMAFDATPSAGPQVERLDPRTRRRDDGAVADDAEPANHERAGI